MAPDRTLDLFANKNDSARQPVVFTLEKEGRIDRILVKANGVFVGSFYVPISLDPAVRSSLIVFQRGRPDPSLFTVDEDARLVVD